MKGKDKLCLTPQYSGAEQSLQIGPPSLAVENIHFEFFADAGQLERDSWVIAGFFIEVDKLHVGIVDLIGKRISWKKGADHMTVIVTAIEIIHQYPFSAAKGKAMDKVQNCTLTESHGGYLDR
nr:hypothetical protein [Desulfolithobacter dissulfuricans]